MLTVLREVDVVGIQMATLLCFGYCENPFHEKASFTVFPMAELFLEKFSVTHL
jgi:hypothetical protein